MLIEIGRTGTEFTQLGQSGQPASVTSVIHSLALALYAACLSSGTRIARL